MKKITTRALLSSSIFALISPAIAQTSADANNQSSTAVETVTVTGSHIISNGFESPTPVTVVTAENLEMRAPSDLPDALNQMPQFRSSNSNTEGNSFLATSPTSGNYLNLLGLGTQLSLILVDGSRVPSTSFSGGIDTNTLPQALVQRVDIVTGGASAVYGSDAVVGVVNFILDKNFTGFKASVQGGLSSYADDASYKATVVAGTDFDGGRGHIEGSLDHYYSDGVPHKELRPELTPLILAQGLKIPTSPSIVYNDNIVLERLSSGGTITSGPLSGTILQPGGGVTPVTYNYKTNDPVNYVAGGNGGYYPDTNLAAPTRTDQSFLRVSYDLGWATAHLQASAAEATNSYLLNWNNHQGSTGITIFSDNPYLAPSTVAALGSTTSFSVGRIDTDVSPIRTRQISDTGDLNGGLEGKFSLFDRDWHWDSTLTYGQSLLRVNTAEENNQRFYAAIDAIAAPAPGTTVNGVTNPAGSGIAAGTDICRVTLVNPGLLPGCVPMNIIGNGSPSQSSINYVEGDSRYAVQNSIGTGTLNFAGNLFDLPAGPLSLAFGGEARHATLLEISNAAPAAASSVSYVGIRGVPGGILISNNTNVGTAKGAVTVEEGYVELNAPILKDLPFAQALDLDVAGRFTNYSTSGGINSWKLGLNYTPYSDLRIRGTLSRDISAPTLYQLYSGLTVGPSIQPDPHTGIDAQYNVISGGNANLKPETSYTQELGVVYSPSWLDGLTGSVDYYRIAVKQAIGSTSATIEDADCDASGGTSPYCADIIRPFGYNNFTAANFPTEILTLNYNEAVVQQSGLEIEGSYNFPLSSVSSKLGGDVTLHTYLMMGLTGYTLPAPLQPIQQSVGALADPDLEGNFEANYANGDLNLRLGERFTGRDHRPYTQGYVGAVNPQATVLTDANFEPNVWYTDVSVNYKLDKVGWVKDLGGEDLGKELYFTVQNLFDQLPPIVSDVNNPGLTPPTDRAKYDYVGRYVTLGLRVKM